MRTKTPGLPDRMLDAAAQLFGAHRFHEVRMDDIAAEAGVGKGTLYRYFADKDELYLALVDRSGRQFQERLHTELAGTEGSVAKLRALVAAIVAFFDERPHLLDLIQRAEVLRGPDFSWQRTRDEVMKIVLGLFAEARERGEFTVRDPELAALILLAGLRGVIRFGKRPRPRDLAAPVVQAFLHGHAEAKDSERLSSAQALR